MSSIISFDQLGESEIGPHEGQRAFWTLDFKDDEQVLRWLKTAVNNLKMQAEERTRVQRKNLAAFRGIQFLRQNTRTGDLESRLDARRSKNPRVVINHLLDMVEQHVSKTTKFRPKVVATPASDDQDDRNTAKVADLLLTSHWEKINLDQIYLQHHRNKRIMGESYLFDEWDESLGPYHPDWIQEQFDANNIDKNARKISKGEAKRILRDDIKEIARVPLKDESGGLIQNDKGEQLFIDRPVRIGDIKKTLMLAWNVWMQRQKDPDDVEWVIYSKIKDIDSIKAQYPDSADDLKMNGREKFFDAESLKEEMMVNAVEVFTMYHRTTDQLDQGRKIVWTRDVILEQGTNPYEGPDGRILPFDRLTDLDIPGVLNGEGLVKHGRPAQNIYNNTISMQARNQFQFSHPKWMVPKGAGVKMTSLSNQTSVVTYSGPQAPTLAQANPSGAESFKIKQEAKEDLQQVMGVFGVSRGEPPAGVTAGIALQFLDEQENERENTQIAKHSASIRNIARMDLSIMGNFYDDEDDRLKDMLGKTRANEISFFKFADLANLNDVKVHTASALPTQKAARIQTILDLSARFPNQMDEAQVLDMLDLGQSDKFLSIATVAVRSSEQENESLERTSKIRSAEAWEDHLTHYKVHLTMMNDPSFSTSSTKAMAKQLQEHLAGHELFMMDIALRNPIYNQRLQAIFPNFPIFMQPQVPEVLQPGGISPEAPGQPVGLGQAGEFALPPEELQPGVESATPVGTPTPVGPNGGVPPQ